LTTKRTSKQYKLLLKFLKQKLLYAIF
jgi:hypothetical protein